MTKLNPPSSEIGPILKANDSAIVHPLVVSSIIIMLYSKWQGHFALYIK
jgi:hypothetical protein